MRALICAQQEAEDALSGYVGTQHLLLGLLRVGDGSAFRALQALGVDEMRLRADISQLHEDRVPMGELRPTSPVREALEHALRTSASQGATTVRTGHLLIGIAHVADGAASTALKRQWLEPAAILAAVDRELRAP
jgi:ATP-dependent Clp protease ATP-binding subunit ClpC